MKLDVIIIGSGPGGYVAAIGRETTEEELVQTVFPHPAPSEMMHEGALDAFGRTIHQ